MVFDIAGNYIGGIVWSEFSAWRKTETPVVSVWVPWCYRPMAIVYSCVMWNVSHVVVCPD